MPPKKVLAVGLLCAPSKSNGPRHPRLATSLRKTLQTQHADAEAAGYALEVVQIKPSELKQKLQLIQDKLATTQPDLFIIGGGIRLNAEYTVFFERLVNVCREASPGTKLGFNTSPEQILEVCRRVLCE